MVMNVFNEIINNDHSHDTNPVSRLSLTEYQKTLTKIVPMSHLPPVQVYDTYSVRGNLCNYSVFKHSKRC